MLHVPESHCFSREREKEKRITWQIPAATGVFSERDCQLKREMEKRRREKRRREGERRGEEKSRSMVNARSWYLTWWPGLKISFGSKGLGMIMFRFRKEVKGILVSLKNTSPTLYSIILVRILCLLPNIFLVDNLFVTCACRHYKTRLSNVGYHKPNAKTLLN